ASTESAIDWLECMPVVNAAGIPIDCDSLAVEWGMFERRLAYPDAQKETERLIRTFLEIAARAPENTRSVSFFFSQAVATPSGHETLEEWICHVRAFVRDGKRTLLFTEEGKTK